MTAWSQLNRTVEVETPNATPVLLLADVKAHVHLTTSDTSSDAVLNRLIAAVEKRVEGLTGLTLLNTTRDLYQDNFGCWDFVTLPFPPLSSVTGLFTTGTDNVETEFANTEYFVDVAAWPGRLYLDENATWPTDLRDRKAVRARYIAGYGSSGDDIPDDLKQIMYDMVGFWYCIRSGGQTTVNIKESERALLSYRVMSL